MIRIGTSIIFCALGIALAAPVARGQVIWNNRDQDRAFLGVTADRVSKRKAALLGFDNRYGEYITSVVEGSAAEKAGLQPLDYLTGMNEKVMDWSTDLSDLLSSYKADDQVTVHLIRKGKKMSKAVTLGRRRNQIWTSSTFNQDRNEPFLGVSEHDAHSDYEVGVRVNIIDGSTADDLGMRDGDVIMSINGYTMIDWEDITGVLNLLKPDDDITVAWERAGQSYRETQSIRSRADRRNSNYALSFDRTDPSNFAFLGVYSNPVSRGKAEKLGFDNPYGSYVTRIFKNSAAEEIGLEPFDYIFGIDEYRTGQGQDLTDILRKYEVGERATVHYIRQGRTMAQQVTFGDRNQAYVQDKTGCDDPFLGVQQLMSQRPDKGVAVHVTDESTAEESGLKDRDIITKINGYPILDWEDLSTAVNATIVGEEIELEYLRDGQRMTGSSKIKSNCDRPDQGKRYINLDLDDLRINIFGDRNEDRPERRELDELAINLSDLREADLRTFKLDLDWDILIQNQLDVRNLTLKINQEKSLYSLDFELASRGDTKVRIYNESGRQIYAYDLGGFSGHFNDEVNIAQNGPGSYVLVIEQKGRAFAKKIELAEK